MSLSSPILSMLLYLRDMYESKCSTYILSLEDFINHTIIDVVQDVEDPIAIGRIKTKLLE